MIRKPEQQIEDMEKINVRAGYSPRRPESELEAEQADEKRKRSPK